MSSWDACHGSACTGSGDGAAEASALGLESLVGEAPEKAAEVNLITGAVWEVRDKKGTSLIDGSPGWSQVLQYQAWLPFVSDSWSYLFMNAARLSITTTLLCYSQGRHIPDFESLATHIFLVGRSPAPRWSIFTTRRLSTCLGLKREEPSVTDQCSLEKHLSQYLISSLRSRVVVMGRHINNCVMVWTVNNRYVSLACSLLLNLQYIQSNTSQ